MVDLIRPTAVLFRSFPAGAAPTLFDSSFFRVQGSGFRVQGAGFRVQGSGLRVQGSGFRVQGSGFKA